MLGINFDWTVTFQPVRSMACQVILEDLIVSATTEMRGVMIQSDKSYKGEVRTNTRIDLMWRMQL